MPTSVSLSSALATVRKRIAQAGKKGLNERDTQASLIGRIPQATGCMQHRNTTTRRLLP
jgi:hypothetical protein